MLFRAVALCLLATVAMGSAPPYGPKTIDSGVFKVDDIELISRATAWRAGDKVIFEARGHVKNKLITDGVAKYQVWEAYVDKFTHEGDHDYFVCDNKGCDTSRPIALVLEDPSKPDSDFELRFEFKVPKPQKTGIFRILCVCLCVCVFVSCVVWLTFVHVVVGVDVSGSGAKTRTTRACL